MRLTREIFRRGIVAALVVVGVGGVVFAGDAWAQATLPSGYQDPNAVSRSLMRSETKRTIGQIGRYGSEGAIVQKFSLPPLPGEASFRDSSDSSEADKFAAGSDLTNPDFSMHQQQGVNIVLPPLKGLSQILDATVTQDLLKRLTAAKVPVMMQTYMMVENGAATGFMGGMNIGSNLMSNMLDTQQYKLQLMGITDDTGKIKEAYAKDIAKKLQTNSDVWPAALYDASGEDGQAPTAKMDTLTGTAFTFQNLSLFNSNDKKALLTDLLFDPSCHTVAAGGNSCSLAAAGDLTKLREDFKSRVGDVSINLEAAGGSKLARDVIYDFVPPKQDATSQLRGLPKVTWEEVQVSWESVNQLLYEYCEWEKSYASPGVFKGENACTTLKIGTKTGNEDPFELASAPDMPLTCNVMKQLYTIATEKGRPTDCKELQLKAADIPTSSAASDPANFNDCSKGGKGGCEKNRTILQLSYFVARSRALYQYRSLYSISRKFATDAHSADLLERVFARVLAGMNIDDEIRENRSRYLDFLDHMSKLSQGKLGGGGAPLAGQDGQPQAAEES